MIFEKIIKLSLGIHIFLDEMDPTYIKSVVKNKSFSRNHFERLEKCANKFNMSIIGVDKLHHLGNNQRNIEETSHMRNIAMKEEISHINDDAVLRVGSAHLQGLLEDKESAVTKSDSGDKKKYRIIPINLSKLACDKECGSDHHSGFSFNFDRVIQVEGDPLSPALNISLSDTGKVIDYWDSVCSDVSISRI